MFSFDYDPSYEPTAPVAFIKVRGNSEIELSALLDSGADSTIIPGDILLKVGARYSETRAMRGIIGKPQIVDLFLVTIIIGPYTLYGIQTVAGAVGSETILGRNVLNHLIVTLNGLAGVTEISD